MLVEALPQFGRQWTQIDFDTHKAQRKAQLPLDKFLLTP